MAKRFTKRLLLTAALLVPAAGALAAAPQTNTPYDGKGTDYFNNGAGGSWHRGAFTAFTLTTNADGSQVHLSAKAFYYCPRGSASVDAPTLNVGSRGRFSVRFSRPNVEPNGSTNGRVYVAISGAFVKGGGTADVSYLVNIVFRGKRAVNPYSTSNPGQLGCASWVRGTAHARSG